MPEQLSLAGFEAARKPTDRLFFAIYPSADAATRIAQLAERLRGAHGLKGRPLPTERFHVTLHHLGDYPGLPQDVVAAAAAAASGLAAPPFEAVFDRAGSFSGKPGNRPLVLRGGDGVIALAVFQQALGAAMKNAGLGRWVQPHSTPHVTLLYDAHGMPELPVEPLGWTVREFVLVNSQLGQNRHVPLARWQLQG